jgi:uncharacterized flavoprotein (TIGR03862 family)
MAADVLSSASLKVHLYEKRAGPGRKLLIAGASGLNVTFDEPLQTAIAHYTPADRMRPILEAFPPKAWLEHIESLGLRTFRGTSRRWFVEGMKAPPLLNRWLETLSRRGVEISYHKDCIDFDCNEGQIDLRFADGTTATADAALFALGGASWEKTTVTWPGMFERHGIHTVEFAPSNAGFHVNWPAAFLAEAEGQPIKNVAVYSTRGRRMGDLVVTAYGLEGTPLYFAAAVGPVHLDLAPDQTVEQLTKRLATPRENLSPIRRLKRCLRLSPAALALCYHLTSSEQLQGSLREPAALAAWLKAFPLELVGTQPLSEVISSTGGLAWSELDGSLRLTRLNAPMYAAGEMIDWDAPTGGYLIQGCISSGYVAGRALAAFFQESRVDFH